MAGNQLPRKQILVGRLGTLRFLSVRVSNWQHFRDYGTSPAGNIIVLSQRPKSGLTDNAHRQ